MGGTPGRTYPSTVKVTAQVSLSCFFKNCNSFDQKTVNDSISKKFHATDRILETFSGQMESLTSAMKNQLSFNKMLETQIA